AVVNIASAIPPTSRFLQKKAWTADDRVRREGSAAIVDAAIAGGVGRLVQESVSMIYPDRGATWIDEGCPPDHFPMARAHLAAEARANRSPAAGGAREEFFALARHHIAVMLGRPDGYVSSIHVADAGAAVAAALAVPAGTYNVVDDEPLTKRCYADAL